MGVALARRRWPSSSWRPSCGAGAWSHQGRPRLTPRRLTTLSCAGERCFRDDAQVSRTVVLPSGARVRGRKLGEIPDERADFLLALAEGPMPPWPYRRIVWPDFWVPRDRLDALDGLREVLRRARDGEVVEVACRGGRGRTGTALAALAVLDGMPRKEAVGWVRQQYDPKVVETPWQAWWVRRLERVAGPIG